MGNERSSEPRSRIESLRITTVETGVVVITFDRPRVRNALDRATMQAFADSVSELGRLCETDEVGIRVVVLTGAGTDAFCSGGDQRDLAQQTSRDDGREVAELMGDALSALEQLPVPTIAAINGHALGGGSEIALACDLRVCDSATRFGLVHLRLALIPGWGAGQRLLRLVGYSRAMEMLLNARAYEAHELEALGLANHVVPKGRALPAALDVASAIVRCDGATVRAIKSLLQAGIRLSYDDALGAERDLFPGLWAAEPHIRAMQGFGASGSQGGSNRQTTRED